MSVTSGSFRGREATGSGHSSRPVHSLLVRNPLYLGNVALWVGFALLARMPWLLPIVIGTLGLEYHAIVRWEERLLAARLGERYREYAARVPRWFPRFASGRPARADPPHDGATAGSWGETLFSERGTLVAIAGGALLLWLKGRVS